ncbi:MAG: glycosyltransferase [Planctomycetota bacterium]
MPTVSVVVPGRNCAATIRDCLEAMQVIAAAPGSPVIELLYVDDHSRDDSASLAAGCGATVLACAGTGAGAARNAGWRHASGAFVWFVDSDCVARANALALLLPLLDAPEVAAVGGSYDNHCPDSLLACMIHEEIVARHRAMPRDVDFLATFNVLYRREALQQLDGFDERYLRGQDAELSFRAVRAGRKLRFEARSRVAHFHERRLLPYLKAQYRQGYWRAYLHMEHTGRASGDSYSRLSDHLQPPLAMLALAALPLLLVPGAAWLVALPPAGVVLLQLPMALRLLRGNGPALAIGFAAMSSARAFWRGVGLSLGVIAKLTERRGTR